MESEHLNPPDDSEVEAWLRRSQPELPDDGFSTRVLAALPPARGRQASRLESAAARWTAAAVGGSVGLVFALANGLSWEAVNSNAPELREAVAMASGVLIQPAVGIAVGVTLMSLLYVYSGALLRRR